MLVINLGSTDGSDTIAALEAPKHWTFQTATSGVSPAMVAAAESSAPEGSWRITLTPAEFLVHANLSATLGQLDDDVKLLRFSSFALAGGETPPKFDFSPALLQRSSYLVEKIRSSNQSLPLRSGLGPTCRYLHRVAGMVYQEDRQLSNTLALSVKLSDSGFIAFWGKEVSGGEFVEFDLRTVYATNGALIHFGVTDAMRRAHAEWYATFGSDKPLLFNIKDYEKESSLKVIREDL